MSTKEKYKTKRRT